MKTSKRGWTLIELVMVIVVISILASIAIIKINDVMQAGKVAAAVSDINIIKRALMSYFGDNIAFPSDAAAGADPGLAPDYIDSWPAENPWEGEYEYNYGTYADFNFDGTAGNEVYLSINKGSDNLTSETCTEVDNLLDDGTTTTGKVRSDGSTYIYIYVSEG
ncbi:MAG: prepilin-type N-terminal cleavage/methylation domain-containing protein [Candidatus Kaelpia imicola]|nr:prepilin-type N-terminal cleavage/methylation domain-containing protein [Candidatus Kaelpia imicola]